MNLLYVHDRSSHRIDKQVLALHQVRSEPLRYTDSHRYAEIGADGEIHAHDFVDGIHPQEDAS